MPRSSAWICARTRFRRTHGSGRATMNEHATRRDKPNEQPREFGLAGTISVAKSVNADFGAGTIDVERRIAFVAKVAVRSANLVRPRARRDALAKRERGQTGAIAGHRASDVAVVMQADGAGHAHVLRAVLTAQERRRLARNAAVFHPNLPHRTRARLAAWNACSIDAHFHRAHAVVGDDARFDDLGADAEHHVASISKRAISVCRARRRAFTRDAFVPERALCLIGTLISRCCA